MWSLMARLGPEPKFHMMQGGYHTSIHPLITNPIVQDKQFSYVKHTPQENKMVHNYTNSVKEPSEPKEEMAINPLCVRKKKKKRRRRRKKNKTKNQPRQRQISIAESEDSFICFQRCESESEFDSSDSVIPTKKVRFASQLCEVHPMVAWSFAYQAARKGPWEEYARDRDRFSQRIRNVEASIGYIFEGRHRERIFEERFMGEIHD